jgi:hypothetical protein
MSLSLPPSLPLPLPASRVATLMKIVATAVMKMMVAAKKKHVMKVVVVTSKASHEACPQRRQQRRREQRVPLGLGYQQWVGRKQQQQQVQEATGRGY